MEFRLPDVDAIFFFQMREMLEPVLGVGWNSSILISREAFKEFYVAGNLCPRLQYPDVQNQEDKRKGVTAYEEAKQAL